MSLLAEHPNSTKCTAYFTDDTTSLDTVYVSQEIWDTLTDFTDGVEHSNSGTTERIAVSIKFKKYAELQNKDTRSVKLKYLVVWAVKPFNAALVPAHGIALSSRLRGSIHALRGSPNTLGTSTRPFECTIAPTRPQKLTELFVIAQSRASYSLAHSRKAEFQDWLLRDQRILRLNEIVSFSLVGDVFEDLGSGPRDRQYDFRISLVEPVAQGYIVEGDTRVILLRGSSHDEEDRSVNGVNGVLSTLTVNGGGIDTEASDEDELTIDESFLASSTLAVSRSYSANSSSFLEQVDEEPAQSLHKTRTTIRVDSLESQLRDESDDTCTAYMRTAELSKIGVFDGDWVVVDRGDITNRRLVKVCSADHVVNTPESLAASPVLRHNIHPDTSSSPHDVAVTVNVTPFGSGVPVIPTAKSATLARIASPVTQTRSLQAVLHNAVKDYFSGSRRLVKRGDLIAVVFGTGAAAVYSGLEELEKEKEGAVPDYLSTLVPQLGASRLDAVAFFQIVNLEYDVVAGIEGSGHLAAASMGELGCWIDTTVTRMMQAGAEHSFVPFVDKYYGLGVSDYLDPTSTLPAYTKLLDFVTVCTYMDVTELGIKAAAILKGAAQCGKRTTAKKVAQKLGLHVCEIDCYEIVSENANHTEGTLRAHFERAISCTPCLLVLRNIDALAQTTQPSEGQKEPKIALTLGELVACVGKERQISGYPMVLIGTTPDIDKVPKSIRACFNREIECTVPVETQRLRSLQALVQDDVLGSDVSLKDVAMQTAALLAGDLQDLVKRARLSAIERATSSDSGIDRDVINAGLVLLNKDFEVALSQVRAAYSRSIGAPSIPAVSWDDVGGLANVKQEILDTVQLPLEHPELFAGGMKKRSGLLLYGPPGTGKTLLAKAVATSCSLNFLSVKGPELLNMYIGESEANVRRVFQRARDAKPCVIFFDELDSVAPKRGNHGDSGGVMDRIVSQLLAELDGMSGGEGQEGAEVFVIGATNRPDLLDPALLRPGRFDRMLYLGVSTTHEAQLDILRALTRKFKLEPTLDLKEIADQCPFNYTGADFYALCSDAMLKAMSRVAESVDAKIAKLNELPIHGHPYPITPQYYLIEMAKPEGIEVLVSHEDFISALKALVPSVSQSEMEHYAAVQQKFAGETINAVKDKGKGKSRAVEIEFDSH